MREPVKRCIRELPEAVDRGFYRQAVHKRPIEWSPACQEYDPCLPTSRTTTVITLDRFESIKSRLVVSEVGQELMGLGHLGSTLRLVQERFAIES